MRPKYPRNIGASARALANMGVHQLSLIAPRCAIDYSAYEGAAGAQAVLEKTKIYNSWQDFSDAHSANLSTPLYKVAFSARTGKSRPVEDFSTWLNKTQSTSNQALALCFGAEDCGLDSQDLKFVDVCCALPSFSDFKSFNLAQAVLLALYILRTHQPAEKNDLAQNSLHAISYESISHWLVSLGFRLSSPKKNAATKMQQFLNRALPTESEYALLEKIIQQSVRKLTQNDSLNKTEVNSSSQQ